MRFTIEPASGPGEAPRCPVAVRDAHKRDVDAVVRLWEEMMTMHFELDARFRFVADAPVAFARHLRQTMGSRRARVFVAEAGGAVVGYVLAELHERPPIYPVGVYGFISDLCVTESRRRFGIGRALFERAWQWLISCDVTAVELHAADCNDAGLRFWKAMGFTPYLRLMRQDRPPARPLRR